jgi:putative membrane protein insertion efficiency factor
VPADTDGAARQGLAQRAILASIRGYQLAFAPMYSGACRFVPSCSAYAAEAVERHGATRGTILAVRRLLRCHPFGSHGLDPVPASAPPAPWRGKPAAVPQKHTL